VDHPPLNRFLEALGALCAERALDEKWLLAPSRRVGRQWLDALARAGRPVLNVRLATLRSLALDLAAPAMAGQGLTLVQGQRLQLIVGRLLLELQHEGSGYLTRLRPGPGLYRLLAAALTDLRLAGLRARELTDRDFEVPAKGVELRQLLAAYELHLQEGGLVDHAGALRLACQRVSSDEAALPEDALVLRAEDEQLGGLPLRLWESIPKQRRRTLSVDPPATKPLAELQLFRAAGPVNEVREVLRRCASGEIPLDRVELVHTDSESYVPLVYELLTRIAPDRTADLPVSFGEGLAVRCFRPGRALAAWVEWVRAGFPQGVLGQMIRDGLLLPEPEAGGPSFARLAGALRGVPVYLGRERYGPALAEARDAARQRISAIEEQAASPDEAERGRRGQELRIDALTRLESIVERVLASSPDPDESDPLRILELAAGFLERCVRGKGRLEEYARGALLGRVEELRAALAEDGPAAGLDAWDWLLGLPAELRVGGELPSPGKLHVSSLAAGGHSGRPQTFILGLDDARFPGAGLQDPLLLDAERSRISGELPRAVERLAEQTRDLRRLLARLRGEVVLGFSCRDLLDDREGFPSPVLLPIFRALAEMPDGDHEALADWLGPPAGFAPRQEAACIDRQDWWLWRAARALPARLDQQAVARCLRFRERGLLARQERESDRFTAFDGYVPRAGKERDLDRPLSASRLETLGRCPLEYFFNHVLGIERPEEFDLDPEVWLDALARGSLLHSVFREFMTRLLAGGHARVEFDRDRPLLEDVLDGLIEEYRAAYPPPDRSVFERERRELASTALIFLLEEERVGGQRAPFCFEASIGLPSEGTGTVLDTGDPVILSLPGGKRLAVRGRIDRIDDADPGRPGQRFWIWDYKTGGTYGYDPNDPLRGGRRVQGPLYLALAEARIRAALSPAARVEGFGYFFPGTRAHGERIAWDAEQLARGRDALAALDEMLTRGCFPFSDEASDAHFSEYLDALGSPALRARQTGRKLENPDNEALAPFIRLRGYGPGEDDE